LLDARLGDVGSAVVRGEALAREPLGRIEDGVEGFERVRGEAGEFEQAGERPQLTGGEAPFALAEQAYRSCW
jgi:hypothetical protein